MCEICTFVTRNSSKLYLLQDIYVLIKTAFLRQVQIKLHFRTLFIIPLINRITLNKKRIQQRTH